MRVRDGHSRQKRHMSKGIGARNATMCMKKPKQLRVATASNVWQGVVGKS